eukprot:152457_1
MAYWLGFLFADGNVCQSGSIDVISIKLKCTDYEHVAKFQNAMQSTYKLGLYKTNMNTCAASHHICDNSMSLDLINLGCIPRKSLTLEWPQNIPDQYIHHFVRGYFDGDGSISFNKHAKHFRIDFIGTQSFVHTLKSHIKLNPLHDYITNGHISIQQGCNVLSYGGVASPMLVLDWMYKDSDASTRLDRKYFVYRKFQEIKGLKPQPRLQEVIKFMNSDSYTKLLECQNQHCCPQLYCNKYYKELRKIEQINKDDLSVIKIWENASTITKELKFDSYNILNVCRRKKHCKTAYGYIWRFANDNID